jgi:hypothetical protein
MMVQRLLIHTSKAFRVKEQRSPPPWCCGGQQRSATTQDHVDLHDRLVVESTAAVDTSSVQLAAVGRWVPGSATCASPGCSALACVSFGIVTEINRVVILREQEAALIVHVLAVFERLLRQGDLQLHQLGCLVADGATTVIDNADIEMAEVVVEATAPLLRQLH